MSSSELKRRERLLRRHIRTKKAVEIVLNEIRQLQIKYANDPDVVDYLLGLESMIKKQLEHIVNAIIVQKERIERLKKQL